MGLPSGGGVAHVTGHTRGSQNYMLSVGGRTHHSRRQPADLTPLGGSITETVKAFELLLRRWVVECTIAWLNHSRRLRSAPAGVHQLGAQLRDLLPQRPQFQGGGILTHWRHWLPIGHAGRDGAGRHALQAAQLWDAVAPQRRRRL